MALTQSESGKLIRYSAGTSLASYTELTLTFYAPSGASKSVATADGVTLGASPASDPTLGSLPANTYVDYYCKAADFDESGTWRARLTYTNTTADPDEIWIGSAVSFTVESAD